MSGDYLIHGASARCPRSVTMHLNDPVLLVVSSVELVDREARLRGFESMLEREQTTGFVADAGSVVGILFLELRGGRAELAMMVAESWREKGIGSRLVARAIEWASSVGVHKVSLKCGPTTRLRSFSTAGSVLSRKDACAVTIDGATGSCGMSWKWGSFSTKRRLVAEPEACVPHRRAGGTDRRVADTGRHGLEEMLPPTAGSVERSQDDILLLIALTTTSLFATYHRSRA